MVLLQRSLNGNQILGYSFLWRCAHPRYLCNDVVRCEGAISPVIHLALCYFVYPLVHCEINYSNWSGGFAWFLNDCVTCLRAPFLYVLITHEKDDNSRELLREHEEKKNFKSWLSSGSLTVYVSDQELILVQTWALCIYLLWCHWWFINAARGGPKIASLEWFRFGRLLH